MNVFIIPSWYPHRCHPLHGTFVLEQAVALGELRPDWNVAISLWGQGEGRLSLAHLRASPRCLVDALRGPASSERELRPNVREFFTRALSWNEAILHGNREAILDSNRKNLDRAARRFGRMPLLHAHVSYPAGWVAMRLSQETGIPYVVTEHMGPFPLKIYESRDGSLLPHIREPLERAHGRVAVGPALAERIASFGIPKPDWIPNLVDERFHTGEPHEPRDRLVFFTLGDIVPVKGFPDLLEAAAALLDRLPAPDRSRVAFRLGGEGPYRSAYRRKCHALGLDPWVSWLGFLPRQEARREFRDCDCYVLASHHESFGIVLVEAIASGRPVIATRCGGPENIVTPENGILVEPGRPDQLAAAMHAVFTGERKFDMRASRDAILRVYSRAPVVDRLEQVYRRALAASEMRPGARPRGSRT